MLGKREWKRLIRPGFLVLLFLFWSLLVFRVFFKPERAFAPRCVKAESLDPEGSMIGYDEKKKTNEKHELK